MSSWRATWSRIFKLVPSFRGWLQCWHMKLTYMVVLDVLDSSIPQDSEPIALARSTRERVRSTLASVLPQSKASRTAITRSLDTSWLAVRTSAWT